MTSTKTETINNENSQKQTCGIMAVTYCGIRADNKVNKYTIFTLRYKFSILPDNEIICNIFTAFINYKLILFKTRPEIPWCFKIKGSLWCLCLATFNKLTLLAILSEIQPAVSEEGNKKKAILPSVGQKKLTKV